MPSRINLYFETFHEPAYETEIVRLKIYVKFRTHNDWTEPFEGIIDTGAYVSVLPVSIWKRTLFRGIKRTRIQGLSPKAECSIPAIKALINCKLVDEEGGVTRSITAVSYLAFTDEIPLIIGFKNLLSVSEMYFNCKTKKAYLNI